MNRYLRPVFVSSVAAFILVASTSYGSTDFGAPRPLTALATSDTGSDDEVELIAGGAGTWIAVWMSGETSIGVAPGEYSPVYSRSTDDGESWSTPQLLGPGGTTGGFPAVGTDQMGRWVATWTEVGKIVVSVSSDDGLTWDPPTTVLEGDGSQQYPSIATDESGTWLLVWNSTALLGGATGGSDHDILFSRSTDDGLTWSPAVLLNQDGATGFQFYFAPRVATDRSGNWVAVWSTGSAACSARSTDNGASWASPVCFSPVFLLPAGTEPSVATDGLGKWIAVFKLEQSELKQSIGFVVSDDNGATWTAAEQLHPYLGDLEIGGHHPRVSYRGPGEWQVVWFSNDTMRGTLKGDYDLLTSYSRDGGSSWSPPAALFSHAQRDSGGDARASISRSIVSGRTIVALVSTNNFGSTIGNDSDILYAIADQDCPSLPREGCRVTTRSGGSGIKLKDGPGGRDSLSWRLRYAEETLETDLGNPLATDSYVLCLYEKLNGVVGLIGEWDARAGASCGSSSCWRSKPGSISFSDREQENGPTKTLSLRAGADGEALLKVSVKGPALAPPLLPLDTTSPVRIQLTNLGTTACWEGVHDQAEANHAAKFDSRSD